MTKIDVGAFNLENIKRFMKKSHPGKDYQVVEYATFYVASFTGEKYKHFVPIVFNKKGALPIPKSFASFSPEECKNPKVIFKSGGPKNVKK